MKSPAHQYRVIGLGGHAVDGSGPWLDGETFILDMGDANDPRYEFRRWDASRGQSFYVGPSSGPSET